MAAWPFGALEGVAVTTDTRQQAGKHGHVDRWLDAHGVTHAPAKLDFGDYMRPESNVSVDTKEHIEELAANVLGAQHDRFRRECQRAQDAGCRLLILVEGMPPWALGHLEGWCLRRCRLCHGCVNPPKSNICQRRHKLTPTGAARLEKSMKTMGERYGVALEFCLREDAARVICERLGVRHGS